MTLYFLICLRNGRDYVSDSLCYDLSVYAVYDRENVYDCLYYDFQRNGIDYVSDSLCYDLSVLYDTENVYDCLYYDLSVYMAETMLVTCVLMNANEI